MIRNLLLFAESGAAGTGGGSPLFTFGLLIVMIVVMYFVAIRPSKKQDQEMRKMRDGLQVGDEITTIGGIIGKIVSMKEDTCVIETSKDRTKIRILKSAVKTVDVPVEATRAPKAEEVKNESSDKKDEIPADNAESAEENTKKGFFKKSKKK